MLNMDVSKVGATREVRENDQMTGAHILIESLRRLGVDLMFGYPGGANLPIYDALALYGEGIKHVMTRHEQGAIHAAEGYARVTGRPGVVLVTSGPGATNLITGIADALLDSTPLVLLTGQVATPMIGTDAFQEADVIGITSPIVKHSYQVRSGADIPRILSEAFHLASTGRPGPVLVDIPKDVSQGLATFTWPESVSIRGYSVQVDPDMSRIREAAQLIQSAKKPLLYIGGGIQISEAHEELRQFARAHRIPVASTLMGLGCFPADDPLFVGMLGMHGTFSANKAITECDLLIACGVRFDDRVTGKLERFSPHSKKIHIDIDPAEIGKNVGIDCPIVSDVKRGLQALLDVTTGTTPQEWLDRVAGWKIEFPLTYPSKPGELYPQQVIDLIDRMTPEDTIITTEVGQHQMWAALFYKYTQPRTLVTSGGLGTMGYGFPAALGAQLADTNRTVVCIAGDASFQMNTQELQTIAEQNLSVKVAIVNNRYIGMVRQWQQFFHGGRYSESRVGQPDFVKLAEAYGILGLRASTAEDAERVLAEALAHPGPVVIDFVVSEEENVFPMVPPGKGNDEMIGAWEEE